MLAKSYGSCQLSVRSRGEREPGLYSNVMAKHSCGLLCPEPEVLPKCPSTGLRKYVYTIPLLTMLDGFEILTTSGLVLWSKSYAPISSSIINGFIKDVFIEEKVLPGASVADDTSATQKPSYKRDQYTLKWASVKDLGLIFVVCVAQSWRVQISY